MRAVTLSRSTHERIPREHQPETLANGGGGSIGDRPSREPTTHTAECA